MPSDSTPRPAAPSAPEGPLAGPSGGPSLVRWIVPPAVAAAIWLSPHGGFDARSWGLLCVFGATIGGLIAQPLPAGAVVVVGVTAANALGLVTTQDALSGFANTTVWLIVAAFIFASGFRKTGLGERIAWHVIAAFGGSALRLGYSLIAADLVMAPVTASNTARAGGVVYPIARGIAQAFDSRPGPTAGRLGAFLMTTVYQGDVVVSALFMTAMAANPLAVEFTQQVTGLRVTWTQWALAAALPGLVSLLLVPLVVHRLVPPEIQDTVAARQMARARLRALGPVTPAERALVAVFVPVCVLWISESLHGWTPTTVAYIGVAAILLSGVLRWQDVIEEKSAWDTLVWFGGLMMLADRLNRAGLLEAFSRVAGDAVAGWSWPLALAVLLVIYHYAHYAFASAAAHVTALFPAFLAVAVAAGAPPLLAALGLGFLSSLNTGLTHYGTGPAVVLFGAGYVSQARWWTVGAVLSLVHLAVWLPIGFAWWKLLGLW